MGLYGKVLYINGLCRKGLYKQGLDRRVYIDVCIKRGCKIEGASKERGC